jgi:hypothetical protein
MDDISKLLPSLDNFNFKVPDFVFTPPPNPNLASAFYERLSQWIADFDKTLDEAHEVGVRLVSFGQSVVFYLTDMGYWNPSLISFKGSMENGQPVELIQHVSQISILLMKLPRKDPTQPKTLIGFGSRDEEKRD